MNLTRRNAVKYGLGFATVLTLPEISYAIGGPSGAKTEYKIQGNVGEVEVNPYKIAPLTAIIHDGGYVITDVMVRIVPKPDGQEIAYAVSDSQVMTHGGIPVFGLYPDYKNTVEVSYTRHWQGKAEKFQEAYSIYTPPTWRLPIGSKAEKQTFPKAHVKKAPSAKFANRLYYINNYDGTSGGTRKAIWNNPEGGALQWSSNPINFIVDTKGEIRWYLLPSPDMYDVNSLWNGGIMMGVQQNDDGALSWGFGQHYVKYDIMGRKIWHRRLPFAYNDFSHSMDAAQNGHYFLRVGSSNLKRADGRHVRTVRDLIIEVNESGQVVDQWRLWEILDPYRDIAIKALDQGAVCLNVDASQAGKTLSAEDLQKLDSEGHFGDIVGTGPGRNWAHVNSVDYDPTDDSIIISSRHQCAVIKIGRDKKVKWILGGGAGWKPAYRDLLLTPVNSKGQKLDCNDYQCENTDFDWTFTQHTAYRIDEKSEGDILYLSVFDNGDARHFEQPAIPSMKYSRAVIYKINQKKHTVEQVWSYGKERGHEWFSPITSLVKYQAPENSVLVYSASAGASYDLKSGGLVSAPNPYLDEFEWGAKEPSIELQFESTSGYQAMVFDLKKAFNPKLK